MYMQKGSICIFVILLAGSRFVLEHSNFNFFKVPYSFHALLNFDLQEYYTP